MLVEAKTIIPSQDFLKPATVRFIFDCIKSGDLDKLPPEPIVRKDENGNLIAIDGHNILAVRSFNDEAIEVHVATSANDGLPEVSDANIARNDDLRMKFDDVLKERVVLHDAGVDSFEDLIEKYHDLFK